MPKKARELSAREVANLTGEGLHAVGGMVPGLQLKIDGGSRSWVLRISVMGKRRDLGVGSYPLVSLSQARAEALKLYVNPPTPKAAGPQGALGPIATTPVNAPEAGETTPASGIQPTASIGDPSQTFERCANRYIDAQTPGWKSGKHAKQWLSTLKQYAFSTVGTLHVSAVTKAHTLSILQPIWTTKTETATRVRGRMEAILDWAKHKGFRQGDNPARWEGNLEFELPSPTKLKKRKQGHHPALPYARMGAFMADLRERQGSSARANEWGILTATRFQEIAGATRGEIDLEMKRWTIPKERMKAGIEHVVPLSDDAIALYKGLPPGGPEYLLFPAPEGGQLSDSALGAMIDSIHEADVVRGGLGYMDPKMKRIATQHGMRSAFRDWAAEIEFFDWDIVEHAIAHKLKDKAAAAYQRGELLMKRAIIMQRWALFCREREFKAPDLTAQMSRAA